MYEFPKRCWCIFVSIFRLILILITAFLNGLNHILFNRLEVVGMQLNMKPQQTEMDKIAYIDSLYANNINVANGIQSPPADAFDSGEFREDAEYDADNFPDDLDDEDDNENGEDDGGEPDGGGVK